MCSHVVGTREKVETAHLDNPVEESYCKREQRNGVQAVWDHPRAKGRCWVFGIFLLCFALVFIGCAALLASLHYSGETANAGERNGLL